AVLAAKLPAEGVLITNAADRSRRRKVTQKALFPSPSLRQKSRIFSTLRPAGAFYHPIRLLSLKNDEFEMRDELRQCGAGILAQLRVQFDRALPEAGVHNPIDIKETGHPTFVKGGIVVINE